MSDNNGQWALILGASSGFGGACAVALAGAGYNIFGIHLDMNSTLPMAMQVKADVEATGAKALFINMNAADAEKRQSAIAQMREACAAISAESSVRIMLHSLAFGTLKLFIPSAPEGYSLNDPTPTFTPKDVMSQKQVEMTLDVMANSLVYWTQDLFAAGLLRNGGRIYAMTSAGSNRVIPAYGGVSAAKSALESHIRQLAYELAPYGITANAIRAGVTDTPALRKIPGSDKLLAQATHSNPSRRLTEPKDIASVLLALSRPETYWMTGNVINVDGGEEVAGV